MILKLIRSLIVGVMLISVISCTDSSSGGGDDGGSDNPPTTNPGEARTNCGVVIDNRVVNPVKESDGEAVLLTQVADSNAFIVTTATGRILVKLHGISSEPSALRNNAISFLGNYTGRTVLLIRASDNCSATVSGGGQAQVGQLITSSGESIGESLVRTGFANASSSDGCGSDLITGCLTALQESDPAVAGELTSFLWKPVADSDGKLAVHTGPYGTTVTVNGEVGTNQGPGNGYGSLARFSKSGCGYPSPKITVRDTRGFAYTVGGQTSFTVGNPCGRHCLVNGSIVACSK